MPISSGRSLGGLSATFVLALAGSPWPSDSAAGAAAAARASDSGRAAAGPERLAAKPQLRNYACLHQSQGYTGFAEPAIRFRLKRKNEWVDRTTAKRVTARWIWKNELATLYSKKGKRLWRFAHFEDSRGRYLVEHPRGSDPLICR